MNPPVRGRRALPASLLVTLLATLLLASACVSVPTSGPVEKIAGQPPTCTNCINVDVAPPAVGDTPREIVVGFLRANSNFQPAYAVARQFLSTAAAEKWSPEARVQIYSGAPQASGNRVVLSGQLVGQLGPDRTYTPQARPLNIDFGLVEERPGEWRISTPPQGLLVADFVFDSFYQPFNLYFIGNGRSLVPNPIYLPNLRNQAGLASVLMRALINGPSAWLKPAVGTALPPGAAVSGDAVTITDGIAEVPLNGVVSSLNDSQRSLLAAQVVYTLGQPLVGISGVRFTVDGQPFRVPGGDPDTYVVRRDINFPDLDPVPAIAADQVYAMRTRGVELINAVAVVADPKPMAGPFGEGAVEVESLAVSPSGTDLAAVSGNGSTLQTGATNGGPVTRVLTGVENLLRPQYSRFGEIWAVGDRGAGQRFWVIGGGKQIEVDPVLPVGARIVAFRLGPDAARIAVVLERAGRTEVGLMRIVRSERVTVDGWRPLQLNRPSTASLTRFADVGWADGTNLIVLAGPRGTAPLAPYRVSEDAFQVSAEGEATNWDAVGITVSLQNQAVIVIGRDGQTWRDAGTQWVEYLDRVRAIAFPG